MSIWMKGSLLLAMTFSAGVALGISYQKSLDEAAAASQPNHAHIMRRLDHLLQLDSSQHAGIAATLSRHQALVDSAWSSLRPRVGATLDSTHAEIMELLHPYQREIFSKMAGHMHGGPHHHAP